MDSQPVPWWDREPPASSGEEKGRTARALIAGACEVLRRHYDLPPLEDVSRQATSKRWDAIRDLFRKSDVAALKEILDSARSRATGALGSVPDLTGLGHAPDLLTGGDTDAEDLPAGVPARSQVLVAPDSRGLDLLELVRRAAEDAGMVPEEGGAA